jgi:ribosomal protein S18 acetylase RimI-like enzyme
MIRDACDSDLPRLAAAMVRIQNRQIEAYPGIFRPFTTEDAVQHLARLLEQSTAVVRVAVSSGAIAGHVVLSVQARPESMFTHSQRIGHIAQIEVGREYRRRGYGRLLLQDCVQIAIAQNLSRIDLDVWSYNTSAQSFFRICGFRDLASKMSLPVTEKPDAV